MVVPSHDRPVRLRWLLNALEEQTLARDRFEVIVGHDSAGPETDALLTSHPLARDGTLRAVRLEPGTAPPGRNRNAAWRAARAPLIAFTDDDCRPPKEWLEQLLTAVRANPGAIVQGRTDPDPEDLITLEHAPAHTTHTQRIRPPTPWAECCNIAYPREVLESLSGFDEVVLTGEDTDLAWRARERGVEVVAAPDALTWHAVVETSLLRRAKGIRRWHWLPLTVRRHPELRRHYTWRIFWRSSHVCIPFAALGLLALRRRPLLGLLLIAPWLIEQTWDEQYLKSPRGTIRFATELPGRAVVDATEFATLAYGSARHRALLI